MGSTWHFFTFDVQGYLESGVVWIQVKASDKLKKTRDASAVLVRVERKDLLTWMGEAYPVILVVYDAARDCAHWLAIQSYFAAEQRFGKLKGKTITAPIPTANLLNENAIRDFARLKAAVLAPWGEPS